MDTQMTFPIRWAPVIATVVITGVFLCYVSPERPGITIAAEHPQIRTTAADVLRHSHSQGWFVTDSVNFRFYHQNQTLLVTRLAKLCEESRLAIHKRWLRSVAQKPWEIKCDVYLYPTPAEYQQRTLYLAESWGFADLEIGQGKVWTRRLHLRSDNETCLTVASVHELTHVILAERFAHRQIPRWADEGIAMNSEPRSRQQKMRNWLAGEVRQGRGFTLPQLLSMVQYPQDKLLGDLFYGQSGSLIEFLLSQNSESEEAVLRIVERWQQQEFDRPSQRAALTKLEAEWKAWLLNLEVNGSSSIDRRPTTRNSNSQ
jgi:hypothetical protein